MKFLEILKPKNWTRLTTGDREETDDLRRDVLFSQIMVVGFAIAILHFINDFINGNSFVYVIDILFILSLAFFYYLNEKGAHRIAKFLDLTALNFMIFLLASIMDENVRMAYNFFPLAILAYLVFYKNQLALSILFSVVSMTLLLILELTDYRPFGDLTIKEKFHQLTLFINVLGSFILIIMGLVLLVKLNLRAEADLKHKEMHLRKTNEELDRFVYSTSHDLRAPLLSIKGLTNLILHETRDATLIDYVDRIDHRIEDLDGFIREIIDYSRNARTEIIKEPIDLRAITNNIFEKLKYLNGTSTIVLKDSIVQNDIFSDKSRLSVILNNIFSNAIKYSDPDRSENWIEISSFLEGQSVCIEVKDNGIGIRKDQLDKVFDMFFRASDASDGPGLGLYIVKEMIDKLGGEISVSSKEKEGTSFTISLPLS
jgi:signal transduction histidine kinase